MNIRDRQLLKLQAQVNHSLSIYKASLAFYDNDSYALPGKPIIKGNDKPLDKLVNPKPWS